ncbi:hypothetical protein SS50377_25356 [Spironucleus salmonicida]|uniref:Uncharacterized protein n=1 Tax=Spironucleus salmonicida TaxID=348837 RepID=V6LBH9_9EUKA|nr:hypothetical protein SS50377_25356 [Spironucleus salmonicida]|eukprot:EST41767.1 hypothetical protein SS50377_18600 [Spironucleus salmonicida]
MNEDSMQISIPVNQVLDAHAQQAIIQKQASHLAAQRFLQTNNARPTKLLLQQTQAFIKKQYPKPQIEQKFINDEYIASISFKQKNSQKNQKELPHIDTKPSPIRKTIGQQKSMLQQIYDIDKQPKPEVPKICQLNYHDQQNGRISGFLLQTLALDNKFDETETEKNQLNYQQIGTQDQIIMQEIQQKVSQVSQNDTVWCVGGLSMFEILNRFIMNQQNPILQLKKPIAPFNESRQKVVQLAKKITKEKIIVCEQIIDKYSYICFPVLFNDIFPNLFYQVLQIFEIEEQFSINQYFKMRTLKKFKDLNQKQEIQDMVQEIKKIIIDKFQTDVDQIIKDIIELGYVKLQSQAGVILKSYYDKNIKIQAPTSINSNDFVTCSMDERLEVDTSILDVLRYLEGFNTSFQFKNISPQKIISKLISKPVAELALIMSQIFEFYYIGPLDQEAYNLQYSLKSSFNEKHTTSAAQKTITLIQTFKDQNQTTPFQLLTEAIEDTQIYNMHSHKDLITKLREKLEEIQQIKTTNIASNIGSSKFVKFLVDNNTPQSLSPQRFREVRTDFLSKYTPTQLSNSQLAKELPYCLLASIVASIKAVEEKFAVVLNSQIGRILEQKFVDQIWKIVDRSGVLKRSLIDLYG